MPKNDRQQGARQPGDIISERRATSSRSQRATSSESARIFPEAARGTGEGQYPWDLMPDSIMTNATVGKVDQAPEGPMLHVTFKGTEAEYTVGPEVPVLANGPGDWRDGIVDGGKGLDGRLTAARITAHGVNPSMSTRDCPIAFLSGRQFEVAFNGCIVPLGALRASIHGTARGSYACQNCLCDSLGA